MAILTTAQMEEDEVDGADGSHDACIYPGQASFDRHVK
jgi:hypothetical protein